MQLENSHGGYAGKSLVNFAQESLDNAVQEFDNSSGGDAMRLQGYVAGQAKIIGIIRGTSVKTEIEESRQRIRENNKSTQELIQGVNE